MAEQYALRDFLEHNRGFAFHLPEFVESTRFIAEVNERFAAFCRGFTPGAPLAGGWAERREEIRHGVREVPAYRCIDWSRPDYWETIPFIDKDDLRSRPDDFISPRYDRAKLWLRETSGTTGPPVSIWYAPEFFFGFHLLSAARAAWVAGRLTEEVRRRTVFCLALVDNKYLAERVWTSPAPFPGLTLRAVFDERRASSARRVAALVARHRPALLTLKPNVLGSLVGRLRAPCDAAARGL
ncbi:MAG TPA: hypothetical protein VFR37_07880, partial [Longimicrobium sp.]|nr:hypothetical protein [Longimicrobium sp.]